MQGIFTALLDFFGMIGSFFELIFTAITVPIRLFGDSLVFVKDFLLDSPFVPWSIGAFIILNIIIGVIAKILGRAF